MREIPGYYFDNDKQKYFKEVSSRSGIPNAKYSERNVQVRRLKDAKTKTEQDLAQRNSHRISRRAHEAAIVAFDLLTRESGYRSPCIASSVHSRSLHPCLSSVASSPDQATIFRVAQQVEQNQSTAGLLLGTSNSLVRSTIALDDHHGTTTIRSPRSQGNTQNLVSHPGHPTSITHHAELQNCAFTWLAGHSAAGIMITTDDATTSDISGASGSQHIILGPGTQRGLRVDVHTSSPAPYASPFAYMFGTSKGILASTKHEYNTRWLGLPYTSKMPDAGSDRILALTPAVHQPHILMFGGGSRRADLLDIRIINVQASVPTPGVITHIRDINQHQVVVAGLGFLHQYDLRFCKMTIPGERQGSTQLHAAQIKPVMVYETYKNSTALQIGFDIDLESKTIAAAQDTAERIVLFSMLDGRRLSSVLDPTHVEPGRHTRCLQFVSESSVLPKALYYIQNVKATTVERLVV